MRLSEEQIERANTVNLPQFLMQNGFDLKRVGREYIWKGHDSMHIKDNVPGERGVWHRFSTDEGGDNIAFLRQYMNMSFVEAVETLNGEHYDRTYTPPHTDTPKKTAEKESVLEINEADNCKRVFAYLCKTRGLDYDLIVSLVKQGLISQEEKRGNVLFKFFDENGKVIGAEKVGTSTEYRFKGIAEHSAEGHGFEVVKGSGEKAFFFESAIDMLSYLQMHDNELDNCRMVSMMGLKPSIVFDTVLRYNIPPQNVFLCSDNDEKGNQFAERLMSEYPDMKRIVTPDTYKDWNDMLRGIPKKEIDTEQKTEVKKEADRMAVGNRYWHNATSNADKVVATINADDFQRIRQVLDDSTVNYFPAKGANNTFRIAMNESDVPFLRSIVGNVPVVKSNIPYDPPEKNIIGNTEYRYIPNKEYISADRDLILKMAETLDKQGIKFSGRIYPTGKGTLTVSRNDLAYVRSVRDNIIGKRRQVGIGEKGQVIGNRSVSAQNRHLYVSTITPKQYEEVKPFIETKARYSGVIRDGKVMFSVDRDEAQAFHRALDTAKREVGLIHTMQDKPAPSVADLGVGDIIMYDGARREIKEINTDRIKMKDLDAPDYGGILLGTSDVLAYDGWQEDMEEKGFEIISKGGQQAEKAEPEDKGPVSLRKVGDFYEMYGKDAKVGEEVLGLRMLSKNGQPMVGFPYHVKDDYSEKLRKAGYSVLMEEAFEINPPKRDKEYSLEISTTSDAFDEPYCIAKVDADGDFIDYYEDADGHIQTFSTIVDALFYAEKHNLDVKNDMEEIPENRCQSLQDVVDRFFGTDCSAAQTVNGTWKITVADGDKVGELFYGGDPVCGIYNRGDTMEIEPYRELTTFPALLRTAMLEHNSDKPVEIMDFQRTFETPLDKAKFLINDFCEAEYREGADFSDLHNVGLAFTTLTDDELPIQVTADLIDFKITYEFDGEVYNTEQYDSIEEMIENGLTGLDFSDLISVPDEVIERHTADRTTIYIEASEEDIAELREHLSMNGYDVKWSDDSKSFDADSEQTAYIETILEDRNIVYSLDGAAFDSPEQSVPLMSDASAVKDISSPADDVPAVTLKYKGDSESLDEIKDKALSLGATVIVDNAEGIISIDTYADHKDELDNLAYELGVMSVDDAPVTDVTAKETEEIDDDAPLFADDDVIEQIQADEKADIPFWQKPDIEGEQLSLFGDPEPIQAKTPDKAKSEFAPGPVVDGVQVFEALAAEIDRGTGFVNGKIRVQEFYEKSKSEPNHPTTQELADFLKKEYGIGGHSGEGNISLVDYDSKGMTFSFENGEKFRHSWHDVTVMTESRLKDNTYLSPEQQEQWQAMKAERSAEENFEPYKVEIGDKFRNKATGVVSEVVSLTGALPYYTDDCTVKRLSGAFEITENISYDKLLNSGLYEYIGRNEPEKEQSAPVKPEKAEVTPDNSAVAPEAEKPEIPTVKNLSQLKKALKPGMMFEISDHLRPECIGERRIVTGVSTVDFTSRKLDENGAQTGKDIHMEFDRAKNWTFDGGELTSRLDNGDMLMSFHFIDSLERTKEPEIATEPTSPELSVGDYLEYKGKEYKVESLEENGFITLNNTAFDGAVKDRVTFIADEFLSNGDFKILTHEKSEEEVTAPDNGENFIISDDTLGEGGAKSKFRANVEAIRTLKTLESEKRPATADEKETLSRYVGWGAIPHGFVNIT